MIAFVIQRLFQAALVMLAVALIAFALFNFVGDPINNMVGQDTSLADRDRLRQELGLNDGFVVQFAHFVGHAATGEFGLSYQQARPVGKIILEKMPATLELSFLAAALALLVGVPMGIYTGLNRHSWGSQALLAVSLVGVSLPTFVIGILLILIFAVWLGWLPADGWGEPKKWILPIMAYAAVPIATYARYARSAVLDTLNKPFVTVLRAKGLSERRVIFQHVMRNSAIPMVTIFLPMFVGIATGSIFVEAMFRVPGLGAFFVSSIDKRDYPLEMALMLLLTMMFCVSYLISDVLYAVLNPRIRIDGGER